MTRFLLDVNVIIALIDLAHVYHELAVRWFGQEGQHDWLTCPITQTGAVRIVSNPKYPNPQPSIRAVIESVRTITATGHHAFVPDDVSLIDGDIFGHHHLRTAKQIIDTYLLALAAHHDAALATFDRRILTSAVRAANAHVHIIIGSA